MTQNMLLIENGLLIVILEMNFYYNLFILNVKGKK